MNTMEIFAYVCRGIAGAPLPYFGMHITSDPNDQPKRLDTWADQSYWALSADAANGYPPVLMHVFFEGPPPDEQTRDWINRHVLRFTVEFLNKGHRDGNR